MTEPRLTDTRQMKTGEAITYEIPWWLYIGRTWRRGERYAAGTYVRPTLPNGFEYECTTAGQTGAREPKPWPTTPGATQADGSVVWTCRAIGNNALDTIAQSTWTPPPGITVANAQVDAVKQLTSARISGVQDGSDYVVLNEITTQAGDEYIFTLNLQGRDGE